MAVTFNTFRSLYVRMLQQFVTLLKSLYLPYSIENSKAFKTFEEEQAPLYNTISNRDRVEDNTSFWFACLRVYGLSNLINFVCIQQDFLCLQHHSG